MATYRSMMRRLSGPRRNAASALIHLFEQYDLGTLANRIIDMVQDGLEEDAITLQLQETREYKERFRGNEQRRKNGLPVLTPAEYIATERAYRQVMQQYGMPKGFYDSPSDLSKFIAQDMSPQELQGRVQVASQWATSQDQATQDALRRLYGLGRGELAAYALDPQRALPLLERQARAVSIGAEAERQGLYTSRRRAESYADAGITAEMAAQGYRQIANILPSLEDLSEIYSDERYRQLHAEQEVFLGDEGATRRRRRLESQERASFGGTSRGETGRASRSQSY